MKTILGTVCAVAIVTASTPAVAGGGPVVQAVQVGEETARFQQGMVTVDAHKPTGAVQITPLPLDHGSLSFGVSVFNGGSQPVNIDVGNFDVTVDGVALPAFTRVEL